MKKIISSILVFALLTQVVGCYSYQEITKEEFSQAEEYLDLQVRTKNQGIYEFDEGDYTVKEDSINGSGRIIFRPGNKFGEDFTGSISLDDIESMKIDKFDTVLTILMSAIGVGAIVLIGVWISNMTMNPMKVILN